MNKPEYDYLKDHYIPFNTKEEMIDIAKFLHDVAGYHVCSYNNIILRGQGYGVDAHKFFIHSDADVKCSLHNQFYRDCETHGKSKLDMKNLGIKSKIKKLNLEDDPFGEEDWGYLEENKKIKKFKDFI